MAYKSKHVKSDYINLCRLERYGKNGNLTRYQKTDLTPEIIRMFFWGYVRKYWRELIGFGA